MEIFRRDGFEVARVDDVAKAAGVSHGTFYFHFATKDEVLIQCLRASEMRVTASIESVPPGAPLLAVLDAAAAAIAKEWEGDPRLFPDVATVAMRYLFRGHMVQMASTTETDGKAAANGAKPRATPDPKSLTAAVLAQRFGAAADRGELSRLLPSEVLATLCLLNLFAATLSWCADPAARPLVLTLSGVSRLFLDGVRGRAV
jgi:AcrR family transcriptional regulator